MFDKFYFHPPIAAFSSIFFLKELASKFRRNFQKVLLLAKNLRQLSIFFSAELSNSPGLNNHRGAITQSDLATEI